MGGKYEYHKRKSGTRKLVAASIFVFGFLLSTASFISNAFRDSDVTIRPTIWVSTSTPKSSDWTTHFDHGRTLLSSSNVTNDTDSSSHGGGHLSLFNLADGPGCNTSVGVNDSTFSRLGQPAIALWLVVTLYMFVGLALVSDDYFVPSLERISEALKLSEDVAGATFMAAGSSAPELFTSLVGSLMTTDSNPGPGTIVGSAVFNLTIIIGLTIVLTKQTLKLFWWPLIRDSAYYSLAIVEFILFFSVITPCRVDWWESLIMIFSYAGYIVLMKFNRNIVGAIARREIMKDPELANALHEQQERKRLKEDLHRVSLKAVSTPVAHAPNSVVPVTDEEDSTSSDEKVKKIGSNGHQLDASGVPSPRRMFESRSSSTSSLILQPKAKEKLKLSLDFLEKFSAMNPRLRAAYKKGVIHENKMADAPPKPVVATPTSARLKKAVKLVIASNNVKNIFKTMNLPRQDPADEVNIEKEVEKARKKRSCMGWFLYVLFFPFHGLFMITIPDCQAPKWRKYYFLSFFMCMIWIMVLSFIMVDGANKLGICIGIDETVMGLTLLAAGTSVPDAISSILVARDGKGDMAVSNAIGSNVFDILLGLGFPWLLYSLVHVTTTPYISVSAEGMLEYASFLFGTLLLFIFILMCTKFRMMKFVGVILMLLYGGFIAFSLVTGIDTLNIVLTQVQCMV
eukprot:CAMPEP_0113918324 /NCGR_PEP_ID=MMETSP0780_2-20120614/33285_1 /TAXON_ID=652834 /ORGANISM="Palpitomonas bilix" /LENGTH=681 /DNA_ID=CAMNT_0000918113 /DNA_START=267 /DNA_END=2312 /DNA_ORIENTATION=- /assembly_acc=CAM_ASM_000599